jgi:hypothetical protein
LSEADECDAKDCGCNEAHAPEIPFRQPTGREWCARCGSAARQTVAGGIYRCSSEGCGYWMTRETVARSRPGVDAAAARG